MGMLPLNWECVANTLQGSTWWGGGGHVVGISIYLLGKKN